MNFFGLLQGPLEGSRAFTMIDGEGKPMGVMNASDTRKILSSHGLRHLRGIAKFSDICRKRLSSITSAQHDLHLLLDTPGGYSAAQTTWMNLALEFSQQGNVHVYGANQISSAGANIFAMTALIRNSSLHCLRDTAFMWHIPRDLEHGSALESLPRNQERAQEMRIMRETFAHMFILFLRSKEKIKLLRQARQALFVDEERFTSELDDIIQWTEGKISIDDFAENLREGTYKEDGEMRILGSDLVGIPNVKVHQSFDELVADFSQATGKQIQKCGHDPFSYAINISRVVHSLRNEGYECKLSADGEDLMIVKSADEHTGNFRNRVQQLFNEWMI
jgi:hypothetical protein